MKRLAPHLLLVGDRDHYNSNVMRDNIREAKPQILPHALEWVWRGYGE